ncbi:hypothetical protein [Polycladidibacter hongkongensis]|uniref:hypothetical protein n=1 Tax=Polycladidibacter hongkongensis TaxID=1647556 RepID=UPI000829B1BE|nr:hypothetical protein [Pseudovibrio hongkongensis]
MRRIVNAAAAAALALSVSACATSPGNITATYIPAATYQNFSCKQLAQEQRVVAQKVAELTGKQKRAATTDAVAVTVGAVIFWPALLLLAATEDEKEQLANLKGQHDALRLAAAQKGCPPIMTKPSKS